MPTSRTQSIPQKKARSKPPARAWQRMLSGRRLDLLDPSPVDIEITDIAHGLARVARWNGQTFGEHAFSVAQHSLVVEEICCHLTPAISPAEKMTALLHDAPEYVIGDMISPFKAVLGDGYRTFEDRLEAAIHMRFGLPPKPTARLKKLIKKADHICAWYEAVELAGFEKDEADRYFITPPDGVNIDISPLPTSQAQQSFLDRFEKLLHEMDAS